MLITSVDNNKIKKYGLLKNRKNRNIEKLFLVEGMHLCIEANKCGLLQDLLLLKDTELEFEYHLLLFLDYQVLIIQELN